MSISSCWGRKSNPRNGPALTTPRRRSTLCEYTRASCLRNSWSISASISRVSAVAVNRCPADLKSQTNAFVIPKWKQRVWEKNQRAAEKGTKVKILTTLEIVSEKKKVLYPITWSSTHTENGNDLVESVSFSVWNTKQKIKQHAAPGSRRQGFSFHFTPGNCTEKCTRLDFWMFFFFKEC